MEYKKQKIEYRIGKMQSRMRDFLFSKFPFPAPAFTFHFPLSTFHSSPHSPFPIPHSTHSGFSLVETLVAIAILLIAVVGPISVIGNSLHQIYYAKDEMLAINLAQEGIEMVRQKRDSNMLANEVPATVTAWDSGITAGTYIVNAPSFSIIACASCNTKIYKNSTGFYSQGTQGPGSVETQFTSRTVVIADIVSGREKRVISTVTWKTGGDTRSITVTEYIFKLRP